MTDLNSDSKMIKFNIACINCCTEVEGPYKRLTIWFQGCNIHCDGCCNPDYQPLILKHVLTLDELLTIIIKSKEQFDIEGVTYSGGEPTLQNNLSILTECIHALGLGVISFTGKCYDEVFEILNGCDAVLDGGFNKNEIDTNRRLLGSKNQRIICLTDRYSDCIDNWFSQSELDVEINIRDSIWINGDKI